MCEIRFLGKDPRNFKIKYGLTQEDPLHLIFFTALPGKRVRNTYARNPRNGSNW